MAWTWSAPQRSAIAATLGLSTGPRLLYRTAFSLGRGDAVRGTYIVFAAFLTVAGFAAPHLSPESLVSLLFLTAAMFVACATFAPGGQAAPALIANNARDQSQQSPRTQPHCLEELLARAAPETLADRAAFARLTAHMSHELRTPLNAILGFSEMMANEVFGPLGSSHYAAYARDIHASGLGLLKSAEDALAITTLLSAVEPGRTHNAHAASLATEALAFHATTCSARGITSCCTVDGDTEILADPHAVRQLLINLIADAAQSASHGAHLSIASRTDNDDFELMLAVSSSVCVAPVTENFSMLLARTLAELAGARLIVESQDDMGAGGGWHATVRFTRAAQNDFFSGRH